MPLKKALEVGQSPLPRQDLTSAELELHIVDCGRHMEKAYRQYEQTHCFSDRGQADYWRLCMEQAISMRVPEQVRAIEDAINARIQGGRLSHA